MVKELNRKFGFHRKVMCLKKKGKEYWCIYIPASDAPILRKHLVYLPERGKYKMPRLTKRVFRLEKVSFHNGQKKMT
jgi:hypothetical protein